MIDNKKIVLSIVVPVYNGAGYVENLTEAVAEQNFDALELIFVDDGSVDDTYDKCRKCASLYDWVRVIHTENCGVSHARNTGIAAARGEWIQFLDVDDMILSGMLRSFYEIVRNHSVDVLVCGCNRFHGTSEGIKCGPQKNDIITGSKRNALFDHLEMTDRYWLLDYVWNKWFKKSIIEQHQIRFEEKLSLGEDFVFNAVYMQFANDIALMETCFYQYRIGNDGLVSKFQPEPWKSRKPLYEAQKKLYQSLGLWESNKKAVICQNGQILFGDMRTINHERCKLSKREKLQYVDAMIASPFFSMILSYLKAKKSVVFKVYYIICNTRKKRLIYALIQMEKIFKRK